MQGKEERQVTKEKPKCVWRSISKIMSCCERFLQKG
jgi:hypothetical protein